MCIRDSAYLEQFESLGMIATGKNPDSGLVEIVEIPEHPYFVASQFHPEYASTVETPHPLFTAFIKAAKHGVGNEQAPAAKETAANS